MTHRIYSTCAVVLALAFPVAALADVTGTPTISSGSDFSFDNGTSTSTGGDIKFTGTSITFVGSATGYDAGSGGTATYNAFSDSTISELGSLSGEFASSFIASSHSHENSQNPGTTYPASLAAQFRFGCNGLTST